MFKDVKAEVKTVLNVCALCEHAYPSACSVCDVAKDLMKDIDPWWGREDVKEARLNVASGEDACLN